MLRFVIGKASQKFKLCKIYNDPGQLLEAKQLAALREILRILSLSSVQLGRAGTSNLNLQLKAFAYLR